MVRGLVHALQSDIHDGSTLGQGGQGDPPLRSRGATPEPRPPGAYSQGMTDAQLALVSAFSAAILTAVGARLVAGFQAGKDAEQRKLDRELQVEQAKLADERNLRYRKLERLARDYEDVSYAASEIQGATIQLAFVLAGDTQESVTQAVNERLNEATANLGRAIHRLRLEGDEQLGERYLKVRGLWHDYAEKYARILAGEPRHGAISKTLTEMQTEVDAILDSTKSILAKLSQPI
jgi:hypothetical protein